MLAAVATLTFEASSRKSRRRTKPNVRFSAMTSDRDPGVALCRVRALRRAQHGGRQARRRLYAGRGDHVDEHAHQHTQLNDSQPMQRLTPESYDSPCSHLYDLTPSGSPSPEPPLRSPSPESQSTQTPMSSRASSSSPATGLSDSDLMSDMTVKCKLMKGNGEVCGVDLLDSKAFITAHIKEHALNLPGHISQCPFGTNVKGKRCGSSKKANRGRTTAQAVARHIYDLHF